MRLRLVSRLLHLFGWFTGLSRAATARGLALGGPGSGGRLADVSGLGSFLLRFLHF